MAARREALAPEAVGDLSHRVALRVVATDEFLRAAVVMAYAPIRNEVDPAGIAQQADRRQVPRAVSALALLRPGSYVIPEPPEAACPEINPSHIDLVLVPGVAYDRRGYRLGYGAGYYDRFLRLLRPDALKVGLAYSFQVLDVLPAEAHDVPVDLVATEEELIFPKRVG